MPAKRPLSPSTATSPSTPRSPAKKKKSKKRQSDDQQPSLDSFFSPSRRKAAAKSSLAPSLSPRHVAQASSSQIIEIIDDSDAEGDVQVVSNPAKLLKEELVQDAQSARPSQDSSPVQTSSGNTAPEHPPAANREPPSALAVGANTVATRTDSDIRAKPQQKSPRKVQSVVGLNIHSSTSQLAGVQAQQQSYLDLAVDSLTFDSTQAPWPSNKRAPYSFLTHILQTLSRTTSRIAIINTLTNGLRLLSIYDPTSLVPALYLLSNSLAPPYVPVELGIGSSVISKAIQHVGGLTPSALKSLYIKTGDIGDVAFEAKSKISTLVPLEPLSVTGVYDTLIKIANVSGSGAAKQKQQLVEKLLVAAKGEETRFLVRTLSLNLRVGAVKASILTALARAAALLPPSHEPFRISSTSTLHVTPDLLSKVLPVNSASGKNKVVDQARNDVVFKLSQAESLLKRVFVKHPNYDHIVHTGLTKGGLDGLEERVPLTVGIPLHPTLGTPTRSLDEVYSRVGDAAFSAEFKYDGQRAQIHASKGSNGLISVWIFSRHLEDMTSKYPDIISMVKRQFEDSEQMTSLIMDSEIVAIDPTTGELKSFQELSNRPRKDVQLKDVKIAVGVFAFDLMYLDGETLLERSFRDRRQLLRTRFRPMAHAAGESGQAMFGFVDSCDSEESADSIENFWAKALESRCEGLMIKVLDTVPPPEPVPKGKRIIASTAKYEADKRTSSWLKLKKDYVNGLGDSLDLVPIGGWHGQGRKAKWWSPILLGIRDPSTGTLFALCKCMSGFSDAFYQATKDKYAEGGEDCAPTPVWGGEYGGYRPSVYFKPQEVWEIRGADITISPVSLAARDAVDKGRGLSLRFPRYIRTREDKSLEQASSVDFLVKMWNDQERNPKTAGGADEGDLVDAEAEEEELEQESEIE